MIFHCAAVSISFSLLIEWRRAIVSMREKFFVLPPLIHQHRFPCNSSPHSVFSHLRRQRRVLTNAQTKWMAKSPINQAIQAQAGLSAKIYCLDLIGPDSRSSIGNPDICTLACQCDSKKCGSS